MTKKNVPIIEMETKTLEKILDSNKHKDSHEMIKQELNFRKQNFNSDLSVNENNYINFNNMVKTFKGV